MVDTKPLNVSTRINGALQWAESVKGIDVRAHYLWTIKNITDRIGFNDLTTDELIALTALLVPAHARFMNGTRTDDAAPAKLRVIRGDVKPKRDLGD